MSGKGDTFSDLERNILLMLIPYLDGVSFDLGGFKPEVSGSFLELEQRRSCSIETLADGKHHLQLAKLSVNRTEWWQDEGEPQKHPNETKRRRPR